MLTDPEDNILRGSITVQLTSCLFCIDSAALLKLNFQQFYLIGQIQTSQTGGQPNSDTSPYGESSLHYPWNALVGGDEGLYWLTCLADLFIK